MSMISTFGGLLLRDGYIIHLPEADRVAQDHGYQCAEQFVRALEKAAATKVALPKAESLINNVERY